RGIRRCLTDQSWPFGLSSPSSVGGRCKTHPGTAPRRQRNSVSRLSDLLRRLEASDPDLAKDLRREVDALADRRSFGLNFERHVPEAVELPGRPVRKGDKVRVLPPRGAKPGAGDQRLWRVPALAKDDDGSRTA